jgi:hypothetical protein
MYFVSIILLLFVLPLASTGMETFTHPGAASVIDVAGKWFTFWAVGGRLFLAGATQVLRPQYTAQDILGIKVEGANLILRELGFANLSMGMLGLASLFKPEWIVPAALVGGLYYGLAGLGHLAHQDRNAKEWTALVTDLIIFAVLAFFVVRSVM